MSKKYTLEYEYYGLSDEEYKELCAVFLRHYELFYKLKKSYKNKNNRYNFKSNTCRQFYYSTNNGISIEAIISFQYYSSNFMSYWFGFSSSKNSYKRPYDVSFYIKEIPVTVEEFIEYMPEEIQSELLFCLDFFCNK